MVNITIFHPDPKNKDQHENTLVAKKRAMGPSPPPVLQRHW